MTDLLTFNNYNNNYDKNLKPKKCDKKIDDKILDNNMLSSLIHKNSNCNSKNINNVFDNNVINSNINKLFSQFTPNLINKNFNEITTIDNSVMSVVSLISTKNTSFMTSVSLSMLPILSSKKQKHSGYCFALKNMHQSQSDTLISTKKRSLKIINHITRESSI